MNLLSNEKLVSELVNKLWADTLQRSIERRVLEDIDYFDLNSLGGFTTDLQMLEEVVALEVVKRIVVHIILKRYKDLEIMTLQGECPGVKTDQ